MYRGRGPSNFHNPRSQDAQKCGRCGSGHGRDGHCPAVGQQCLKCHKAGHTEDQRHVSVCARAHARAFVACVCVFGVCACV